jgi:hypothetical protein
MAEKTKSVQEGGIVFGDWKLFPVDSRNWELCHRHEVADTTTARRAGTVGRVQWNRLGRFYQCNTFDAAIQYAADCELKDGCRDRATGLSEAIAEYRTIVDGMSAAVIAAVRGQE